MSSDLEEEEESEEESEPEQDEGSESDESDDGSKLPFAYSCPPIWMLTVTFLSQTCYSMTPDNSHPLNAVPCPEANLPSLLVAPNPRLFPLLANVFTLSPNPPPPKFLPNKILVSSLRAVPPMVAWRCLSSLHLNHGLVGEVAGVMSRMTRTSILAGQGGGIGWKGSVQGWRRVIWRMMSLKDEEEGCRGEDREGVLQKMLSEENRTLWASRAVFIIVSSVCSVLKQYS